MKISDVLDFCDLVLAQYGNLDVLIVTEFPGRSDFALNQIIIELLQVPVSRFSDKTQLIIGMGHGNDVHYDEDKKIAEAAMQRHLRVIK